MTAVNEYAYVHTMKHCVVVTPVTNNTIGTNLDSF
jgi:hypothetical protein